LQGRPVPIDTLSALQRIGIGKCHAFVFQSNAFGELFRVRAGWQRREDLYVFSRLLDLKGMRASKQ
jgi:hypothetical protein